MFCSRNGPNAGLGRLLGDPPRPLPTAGDPRGLERHAQRRLRRHPGPLPGKAARRVPAGLRGGLSAGLVAAGDVLLRPPAIPHRAKLLPARLAPGRGGAFAGQPGFLGQPGGGRLGTGRRPDRSSAAGGVRGAWPTRPASTAAWSAATWPGSTCPTNRSRSAAACRFDLWSGPLVGLFTWAMLVSSLVGSRITWRGIVYRLLRGGKIQILSRAETGWAGTGLFFGRKSVSCRKT